MSWSLPWFYLLGRLTGKSHGPHVTDRLISTEISGFLLCETFLSSLFLVFLASLPRILTDRKVTWLTNKKCYCINWDRSPCISIMTLRDLPFLFNFHDVPSHHTTSFLRSLMTHFFLHTFARGMDFLFYYILCSLSLFLSPVYSNSVLANNSMKPIILSISSLPVHPLSVLSWHLDGGKSKGGFEKGWNWKNGVGQYFQRKEKLF